MEKNVIINIKNENIPLDKMICVIINIINIFNYSLFNKNINIINI